MSRRPGVIVAALAATLAAALTAACATTPQPLPEEAARQRLSDMAALFDSQESIRAPLTLADAMARAVKYNVDARVALMNEALARRDLDLASVDLLPTLAASAGYSDRSNDDALSMESVETGSQSLEPSTFTERDIAEANAELVWNALDFGVSYVTARQHTDQVLIAEQRRRKALQNIIQDVNFAYWRALAAQELGPRLAALLKDIRRQLDSNRAAREAGDVDPREAARERDKLLTAMWDLNRLRSELELARSELARLMNVAPGTRFTLAPTEAERELPRVARAPGELEEMALVQRPELRREDYRRRIDALEVRKALLRMLPGVEVDLGAAYDSNDFLVNNEWSFAGVRVVWNLFNVFTGPAARAEARTRVALDDMRRMALSMAVLTQLHVAYERLRAARARYDISSRLAVVSDRISGRYGGRAAAPSSDATTEVMARARALGAVLQREQAFAALHNAVGRIQNSLGMDAMPGAVRSRELENLSEAIARRQSALDDYLAIPGNADCGDGGSCPGALALY